MSAADRRRARPLLSLPAGAWVAFLAAMLPLLGVIAPGPWSAGVLLVSGAVFAAGFVARWYRLPAVAVALIETGAWVVLVTAIFLRDAAIAFVVPTLHALRLVPEYVVTAMHEIQVGFAPLQPSAALAFCIVTAAGAVAIITDHVAVTARMPLAAAVGLVAVSLIPSLAVPAPFDAAGFAVLAIAILILLRAETRARFQPDDTTALSSGSPGGTTAIAVSIGLVAVLVAVAATPLLPEPQARAGLGPSGTSINASLDLGRDLRRPDPVTVLTLRTTAPSAPYLRVATLSYFTRSVWQPDVQVSTPLDSGPGFGGVTVEPGVDVQKVTTRVRIDQLEARYLPVPYPATALSGAPRGWEAMSLNRTVVGNGVETSSGEEYTITTEVPEPTLEQIEAATAQHGPAEAAGLPRDLPSIITRDAYSVTRGTDNDYDALVALQNWFRGPAFEYSLTAPVQAGFDGSGIAAVADFLKQKKGYCIHFASAFAIMARVLGMSSRVVVGYLPGTPASTASGIVTDPVYTVTSSQLHAWPEVFFSGIGWVAFDPTKSLGEPTAFAPAATSIGPGRSLNQAPSQSAAPAPAPSSIRDPAAHNAGEAQSSAPRSANLVPLGAGTAGVVVILLLPMLVAAVRRRRRDAAARRGDTLAAWASVRDVAIDLGIPVPVSESPRAFGARLVREHGAPPGDARALVEAVEAVAFAPDAPPQDGSAVVRATDAVRAGLYLGVAKGRRTRAVLFPRSLIVRPGSVYAGAGASTPTR